MPSAEVVSIQGRRQKDISDANVMSDADLHTYVDGASDGVLACRQRGRHWFAPMKKTKDGSALFDGQDSDGLWTRRSLCTSCELVERVEHWLVFKQGRRLHAERVKKSLNYFTDDDGNTYLAPPNQGRAAPTRVEEALMDRALNGLTMTSLKATVPAQRKAVG